MGACCSEDLTTKEINQNIQEVEKVTHSIEKVLLLGTGGSGKSTLFKQLKIIHSVESESSSDDKDAEEEKVKIKGVNKSHNMPKIGNRFFWLCSIRHSSILAMLKLLEKSHHFYTKGHEECYVDVNDQKIQDLILTVREYQSSSWGDPDPSKVIPASKIKILGDALHELWNLPGIVNTFRLRDRFFIDDCVEYFLEKSTEIFSGEADSHVDSTEVGYQVTMEDYLRVRVRTTGMNEIKYDVSGNNFHVIDVGGQRSERRKWLKYFDQVRAVVFVASLNAYNRVVFEDEDKNAMQESIEVFREVRGNPAFVNIDFILMLNKNDLFEQSLYNGVPLGVCFSPEKNWKGTPWDGPDFHEDFTVAEATAKAKKNSEDNHRTSACYQQKQVLVDTQDSSKFLLIGNKKEEKEEKESGGDMEAPKEELNEDRIRQNDFLHENENFMYCYTAAINFIRNVYESQIVENGNKKKIYVHVTTATDRDIIERVFYNVQHMIVQINMRNAGVIGMGDE